MADQNFDLIVLGERPRRLRRRDPRRAARHEDRGGGARSARRHLPQLGLHPDQGAAAHLRDQPPAAPPARLRFRRGGAALRDRQGGEALARGGEAAFAGRRVPAAQAQGHRDRRHRQAGRQADARGGEGRQAGRDAEIAAHHPGDRCARAAASGDRGRRQADLDLQGGDDPAVDAEVAAGDRLRRDRHRVRQLLSQHGRRGDGGGGAAADSSSRGRGDFRVRAQGVREAGHSHPGRRGGEGGEEGPRQRDRRRWRRAARARRSRWIG